MISRKKILCTLILTAVLTPQAHAKNPDANTNIEKCYGVSKAGMNDCASRDGKNSCAGHATKDSDPNNWVYVPVGLCEKLVGGVKEKIVQEKK